MLFFYSFASQRQLSAMFGKLCLSTNKNLFSQSRQTSDEKRDTCVHFTRPFATQQYRSEPGWLQKIWEKCSSGSSKFMTSMNWSSGWSMYGIVSSKASSMTQLMSGTNVSAREFVW